jgi:hypothetical protein
MQWIAVSGFLLASGSVHAGDASSTRGDETVRPHLAAKLTPPEQADLTITDQGRQGPGYGVSTVEPEEARPQGTAGGERDPGAQQVPVTVDLAHPGGDFPWGG